MRNWMIIGAVAGLVGGVLAGLLDAVFGGALQLQAIALEAVRWSVGLALAAAVAYFPSHWAWRGVAGGATFGVVQTVLSLALSSSPPGWIELLISEVIGGVVGGLIIAYVWRPDDAPSGPEDITQRSPR